MTKLVGMKTLTRGIKQVGQVKSPEGKMAIVPNIVPLFDLIFTSAHSINTDHSKIITPERSLSEYQVVVAVSKTNENFKVGDWIRVNVDAFPRESKPGKHDVGNKVVVHPPLKTVGNTEYLALSNRHILYKVEKELEEIVLI